MTHHRAPPAGAPPGWTSPFAASPNSAAPPEAGLAVSCAVCYSGCMSEPHPAEPLDLALPLLLDEIAKQMRTLASKMRDKPETVDLVARAIYVPEVTGALVACGVVNTTARPEQILGASLIFMDQWRLLPGPAPAELDSHKYPVWDRLKPARIDPDHAGIVMLFFPHEHHWAKEYENRLRNNAGRLYAQMTVELLRRDAITTEKVPVWLISFLADSAPTEW
jgi:hypothetical protein